MRLWNPYIYEINENFMKILYLDNAAVDQAVVFLY